MALVAYLSYLLFATWLIARIHREPPTNILPKLFSSPLMSVAIIGTTLLISIYFYPIADARKFIGLGSDQDDCIIIGASRIIDLTHPYLQRTYLNNPCSPGIGILILFSPFVLMKLYILGSITSIIYCAALIAYYSKKVISANIFLLISLGSVIIPELLVDGSDLVFIGYGIAAISIQMVLIIQDKNYIKLFAIAVICGLLSSSRVNFLVLSPILSLLIYPHWKNGALVLLITSCITALAPSIALYMIDPQNFTPLHLVAKGESLLPPTQFAIVFIISICMLFYGLILSKKSAGYIPLAVLFSISPLLIGLAFGDLAHRDFDLGSWYGANYLAPLIPLASSILVIQFIGRKIYFKP